MKRRLQQKTDEIFGLMPRLAKGEKAPDVPPVDIGNLYSSILTRAAAADICVSLFGN